jgi:DNA modification methylase
MVPIGIACEKTNRRCFGMEIDPLYTSVIIERWCKFTAKEAYRMNEDGTKTAWSEVKSSAESASVSKEDH